VSAERYRGYRTKERGRGTLEGVRSQRRWEMFRVASCRPDEQQEL
jgi:hypothetical protein